MIERKGILPKKKPDSTEVDEAPYAVVTIRLFRKRGFELMGEGFEFVTPGYLHRIMPGIYRELRRIKGKLSFDADRLEREARDHVLTLDEAEDVPIKPRKREVA